ncbi:MAG: 50S ribosomal protein L23 [Patescibacteria group bacterium]|nr:50S ribosomal protein L23 [Patescibacteria group bacterium]
MALFNISKKNKIKEKKESKKDVKISKKQKEKGNKPKIETKKIKKAPKDLKKKTIVPKARRVISTLPYQILKSPHITEKASELIEVNQYIFKIYNQANKIEVKKAIEALYGINVLNVKIINVHRKRRKMGKTLGWKKGFKKAIIKIEKGQKIEVMPR